MKFSPAVMVVLGTLAVGTAQDPAPTPVDNDAEAAQARKAQPMPVPRSLLKRRGETAIAVDGSLQEWPSAPPLLLDDGRQLSGTALGAWRGSADLAARVFLLWDDTDLFVAAVVRDDWHRPLAADSPRLLETPPADSVVLSFDPDRNTRAIGYDEGRREDREFWLAEVEGQGRRIVSWDRFRGMARFADDAAGAVVRDRQTGLTTYEARIPWREILPPGRQPKRGDVIDLQVVVSDFDEVTDVLPQTRAGWTFGTGPRIDPGLYGSVMLVDTLDAAPAELPEFPPPPPQAGDPVPGQQYFVRLYEQLRGTSPIRVERDSGPPEDVGGIDRLRRLEELERFCATFPRVDYLEYHQRVHRRMRREVAGMIASGLPFLWEHVLGDVARRAEEPPPERHIRIFRLPVGGWLVRSATANFAIDPSGHDVESRLWGGLDFVLLTSPRDICKRNDQVVLRCAQAHRRVFAHQAFSVPGLDAASFPLTKIGETYAEHDLKIRVLGITKGELVSPTCGYVIEWPNGTTLVHAAESADGIDVGIGRSGRPPVDLLILSARHPSARVVGQRVGASLTVIDDILQCPSIATGAGRVALPDAWALQNALRPHASLLLGPGEMVDVPPPP